MVQVAGLSDSRKHGAPADIGTFQFAATAMVFKFTFSGTEYTVAMAAGVGGWTLIANQSSVLNTDQIVINAAIVYVSALGGGEVYLSRGTYNLGAQVVTTTGITIKGAGIDVTSLILQAGVFQNVIEAVGTAGVHLTDIVIRDLTVNPNWTVNPTQGVPGVPDELDQNGISLQYVDNALLENVRAYDCPWNGIQAYKCTYITCLHCLVEHTYWHGIMYWSAVTHSQMRGCEVIDTGSYGLVVEQSVSRYCIITDNVVTNVAQISLSAAGIGLVSNVNHCMVSNNIVVDSGVWGIVFSGATYCIAEGNVIENSSSFGIYLTSEASDALITGNTIHICGADGIYTTEDVIRVTISDNYVDEAADNGINIYGSTDINILGNFLYNNNRRGILIWQDATQIVIDNNFIDGVTITAGIELTGAGTDEIIIGYNRTINVPVVLIDGAGGIVRLPTISGEFPLSNVGGGAAAVAPVINTSPGGIDIDAVNEFAHAKIPLPTEIQQVVRIKIWAYSNVIEAANNMLLRIVAHGAGSSELWSGNAIDVPDHPSEETGGIIQYDVIHWVIDVGDDAQVGTLAAQDLLELLAVFNAVVGADIATDALFGGYNIEYV